MGGESRSGVGVIDNLINNGTNKIGKNVEKTTASLFKETGYAIQTGDFSNYGNTLLEAGAAYATGGLSLAAGYKAGETGTERKAREMAAKAGEQAAADAQAAIDETNRQVAGTIAGAVGRRKTAVGRNQTLVTSGNPQSNTLLTVAGRA